MCTVAPPEIQLVEMTMEELETLIAAAKERRLDAEESKKFEALVKSLLFARDLAKEGKIAELKDFLVGSSSPKNEDNELSKEGQDSPRGTNDGAESSDSAGGGSPKKKRRRRKKRESNEEPKKGHGRNGADAYTDAKRISCQHESFKPGDRCPDCGGTLYEMSTPAILVRIKGAPALQATIYESQRLRCNGCGTVHTAELPEDVGDKKYDETAAVMIGLLKYGSGMPFNRIEGLQGNVGVPLPASTQCDLVKGAGEELESAFTELIWQAAQADLIHNDDTSMRVVSLLPDGKEREATGVSPKRTGTFTTGIVAVSEERQIAIFRTGAKHAGENLAEILEQRAEGLRPPIQMCDALDRNLPGEGKTIVGNCLAHAFRKFEDLSDNFPEECEHVMDLLGEVYKNDSKTKKFELSPEERLLYHQEHSAPVMEKLKSWFKEQLEEKKVEPNSGLGKAIRYMMNHWEKLTLFLRKAGAPLDNNICERILKKAILHRKNALLFMTRAGAQIGDNSNEEV